MHQSYAIFRPYHRGAVLLNVLIFVVITSILLAGTATVVVSDFNFAGIGASYAAALYVAEAGINYELRKISNDPTQADQKSGTGSPGVAYASSAGNFAVYVTRRNSDGTETTPWIPGSNLWIYSAGTVKGVTRTVKVAAQGYSGSTPSNYAVFGGQQGLINGSACAVNGDVGTNGFLTFNGKPSIEGKVIFNGPTSNWQSPPSGSYTVVHNSTAVSWPTVENIAISTFGSLGLAYVAVHNDNALASPPVSGAVLINSGSQSFVGKPGGANYYITGLTCNGSSTIAFNNTNGPITIWVGPSGASSTFVMNGGTAAIRNTADPTKQVRIYIATTNDVILNGNTELDAGIYNINNSASGRVILNGSPVVAGALICNMFTFNGTPQITYQSGYFSQNGIGYYGGGGVWQEIGEFY